jgi:hypothetical protein
MGPLNPDRAARRDLFLPHWFSIFGSRGRISGLGLGLGDGSSGELPITLTRPDRSVIQQQKTPVSIFGLTFYRPVLERL